MSTFLALSGNTVWWKRHERVVLVSSWIVDSMKKNGWQADGFEVMPNPWWDHGRTAAAARYLDELTERLLGPLAAYLNGVHELNASPRYWRVLIGPWLAWHLRTYYDRYIHLQEAFRRHPGFDTVLLPEALFVTPDDTAGFHELLETDSFNFQFFSELLRNLGCSFQTVPAAAAAKAPAAPPSPEGPRGKLGFSNTRSPVVMLHEMYCDPAIVNRIIESLSPNACVFAAGQGRFTNLPRPEMNPRRLGLAQLPAGDEFQSLFVKSLPQNFPALWLEGFDLARRALIKPETVFPSVIISANAWYDNEVFKFFSAHAGECGCRLVIAQHGGGYGVWREFFNEDLDARIANTFFVWGWSRERKDVGQNAPCLPASDGMRHSANAADDSKTKITFFSTDCTPYMQSFRSHPALDQWEAYFEWQLRFVKSLPGHLHLSLLYRPYMADFGRGIREKILALAPSVSIDSVRDRGGQNFQRLFGSRLCVIDHNCTTFLYSLAVNVPTVLYWDPELWPVRPEAQPYFDDLKRAAILWDTPEAAASHVAAIYDDPMRWWGSSLVQEVRQRFASHYALTSSDWLGEWKILLLHELKLSQRQANQCPISERVEPTEMNHASKAEPRGAVGLPATSILGYRIETWMPVPEMRQIEYADYWNDVDEERKKEWWILDGDFQKMEVYLEQSFLLPQLRQQFDFVKARLGRKPEGVGADLAAGNLWAIPHVLKAGDVGRIFAVEYSIHRIIQIGPHVLKAYGVPAEKVVLCLGSFYELKIPTGSLDFVFMSQAFHHADDPLRLLSEIRRVLRPGGLVFMIGEHITATPKIHLSWLQGLRGRLLKAEDRRAWKPIQPPDPVLGDHCYFEEEYDAMFSGTGFTYHNLRMAGAKFQSFVLIRDNALEEMAGSVGETVGIRAQLRSALSRLNRRFQERPDVSTKRSF